MSSRLNLFLLLGLLLGIRGLLLSDPDPDTSEKCLSCQEEVLALQAKWTDPTSVEAILSVDMYLQNIL